MVTEKQIDLFEEIEAAPCCIFHCISADLKMGKGIAKPMNAKFHIRELWKNPNPNWYGTGHTICTPTDTAEHIVFNLITKEKYWQKPNYKTMEEALTHAREYFNYYRGFPKKIVMPKIGCGLDQLNWPKVKKIIERIFEGFDVTVCYL